MSAVSWQNPNLGANRGYFTRVQLQPSGNASHNANARTLIMTYPLPLLIQECKHVVLPGGPDVLGEGENRPSGINLA